MNRRMLILGAFALILLLARILVSLEGSSVSGTLFGFGNQTFELNPAEEKKMSTLLKHPVLDMKTTDQDSSSKAASSRNPFLYGRPVVPQRTIFQESAPIVEEQVIVAKPEIVQRFSGQLFGMTEFPQSGRRTVLLSTSQDTMLLKEGELIDDRYMVKHITTEHVIIEDQQSGQELTLYYVDEPR